MSKKVTIKENYIDDVDASVDIEGMAVEISGQSIVSIQFVWDDKVSGIIDLEISNDGKTYTPAVMEAKGPDGNAAASEVLELKTGSRFVRGIFRSAPDSSGFLTAHLVSKREG